ncbi:MAG: S66 peptidase family protein [Candidatus Moranbacteria bacterium]|nr:S66 peptidase family protein [Candidatus Moranbacteria bacterium]
MIPQKLKAGDEIRVIAPSMSLGLISDDVRKIAQERLEKMGLKVTYSKKAEEKDEFISSSIESRVTDLHEAFLDKNVKGILTVIGGFNANQILSYLDYDLIKDNSKILCGYSDITALANAIYRKTGLITYSGPHFSTFGMQKGIDYTIEHFKKCLIENEAFEVHPSGRWSDDAWYKDQENREFFDNEGCLVINEGQAKGKTLGGNLCTFNLLNGTEFMPNLEDSLLFIEDDDATGELFEVEFDRNLQSLIHQPGFSKVKGVVIGRFQKSVNITKDKLVKIIKSKKELENMPVIYGADFGHTTPQFTFPIGGAAEVSARGKNVKIEIAEH